MYHGERFNSISHLVGAALALIGMVLLVGFAAAQGDPWKIISFSIYGVSLFLLYSLSTLYHSLRGRAKEIFQKLDHVAIYLLIAGTYTPFTLVTLNGSIGWLIFGISWSMALTGITLKLFFTGRYKLLSTLMYVFMGWLIIFAIKPLANNISSDGLYWLVAGGLAYTLGAILYGIKKIRFNHAIFHVCVLIGSFCHFMAVFNYILPE